VQGPKGEKEKGSLRSSHGVIVIIAGAKKERQREGGEEKKEGTVDSDERHATASRSSTSLDSPSVTL
jgi:hypothetical protein